MNRASDMTTRPHSNSSGLGGDVTDRSELAALRRHLYPSILSRLERNTPAGRGSPLRSDLAADLFIPLYGLLAAECHIRLDWHDHLDSAARTSTESYQWSERLSRLSAPKPSSGRPGGGGDGDFKRSYLGRPLVSPVVALFPPTDERNWHESVA